MKITVKNYESIQNEIDRAKLPTKVKEIFDLMDEVIPYYGQDKDITESVDFSLEKLNEFFAKNAEKPKPKAEAPKKPSVTAVKKTKEVKPKPAPKPKAPKKESKPKPAPKPKVDKEAQLIEKLKGELATLKKQVVDNTKFKDKIAAEMTKFVNSQKTLSGTDSVEVAVLKGKIKFYKNLLKGDDTDFKAIAKRIGLDYKRVPVRKASGKKETVAKVVKETVPETPKEPEKVLFDPAEHFERYNGGWTKIVKGLDKKTTDGFSIVGGFTTTGKKDWYKVGQLYLDCGIGGSRKNQTKYYTLFVIDPKGKPQTIAETKGKNWAVDLWPYIENYGKSLSGTKKAKKPEKKKSFFERLFG